VTVNFQFPTPTLSATMHSVTNRQTDDNIMPLADQTALRDDRLKVFTFLAHPACFNECIIIQYLDATV